GRRGLPFAQGHRVFGGTSVDMMVATEALGEARVVEPYLATVGLGGRVVARAGSAAQQERILPSLIQGKLKMALAQTERGARYDLRQVSMRARTSGDSFVLDGEKCLVLHGGGAGLLVAAAGLGGGGTDPPRARPLPVLRHVP